MMVFALNSMIDVTGNVVSYSTPLAVMHSIWATFISWYMINVSNCLRSLENDAIRIVVEDVPNKRVCPLRKVMYLQMATHVRYDTDKSVEDHINLREVRNRIINMQGTMRGILYTGLVSIVYLINMSPSMKGVFSEHIRMGIFIFFLSVMITGYTIIMDRYTKSIKYI